jgi:glycosyltransferase involved in cell wall biosynthesis
MEPSRLISFIIPCYNGEDFAIGCIKSILAQKIPEPLQFEIILVDNNSTDGTVLKVKSTFGDRVKVVHQPIQGRSHARNLGFQNSKGKFLCFVDVDVELSQDWFLNCYEAIKKNPDWSIVSTIIKLKSIEDTWFERWRVSGPKVQYENSVLRMNRYSPCINTAATIMRRDLF